jgi:hypothetical protein
MHLLYRVLIDKDRGAFFRHLHFIWELILKENKLNFLIKNIR